ncbi:hypothetical protein BDZ91DRAFT_801098 [Kalaharituber pfeilii]|nr:hypothetical protein BDZ91DRAFT_801098 [Kalaharituber pfeilii]
MELPDFQRIQNGLGLICPELSKIPNIPGFDLAARMTALQEQSTRIQEQTFKIQEQIVTMQQHIVTMQQNIVTMQQHIVTMQQNIVTMQQQTARNHKQLVNILLRGEVNSIARFKNGKIYNVHLELEPLRDLNNAPIVGFPRTPRDISQLGDAEINRLLSDLGLPQGGTLDQKKDRFRDYIGLAILA